MAEDSAFGKLLVTGTIIVMMIPGLIVEPGPVSEIVGLGAILAVWGFGDEVDL